MLVPMADGPDEMEQVKLANNLSYLGADTVPTTPAQPAVPKSASQQAQDWITTLTQGAASVAPLFRKTPVEKKPKYDPNVNPGWSDGSTDWTNYLLIGGGVLLGGVVLYSVFKKKKKGRR